MLALTRTILVVVCLTSFALAGCSDTPAATSDVGTTSNTANAAEGLHVASPPWQLGDWWTHDWSFASGLAFSVKTIVVDNSSGIYTFATDNAITAAQGAAFFFMELGTMDGNGIMTNGDYQFPWYQFPLMDNKTWTANERNLGNSFNDVQRTLTLTARQNGLSSFLIEARLPDGSLYVQYDYQAKHGWFDSFTTFAQDETGADVPVYTITTSSSGRGYTGDFYLAQGDFALAVTNVVTADPMQPTQPAYQASFTIGAEATEVMVILYSFGVAGAHHTQLISPDGQHWEASAVGDPNGNNLAPPESHGGFVYVPAVAGTWQVAIVGASPFAAGGGLFAWSLTSSMGTL